MGDKGNPTGDASIPGTGKTTGGSTIGVETERKNPWQKKLPRGNRESLATGPWVPVFCEFRFVKMLKGPVLDLAADRKQGDHCMERTNSGEEGAACQRKIWTPRQAQTTERGVPFRLGTAVSRKGKGP